MRVRNALLVKAHHDHLKDYARELEHQVRRRTAELAASRLELIHCLARAAEYRDNETGRHVVRVGRYAEIISRKLGLDEETVELIGHAAPLHDMGKIGIPDGILLKPDKLDPDEFETMQKHSVYGKRTFEPMSRDEWRTFKSHTFLGEMIMDIESSPIITMAAKIALTHHEKWDGTGYPLGLSRRGHSARRTYHGRGGCVRCARAANAPINRRSLWISASQSSRREAERTSIRKIVDAFLACREAIVEVRIELRRSRIGSGPPVHYNQPSKIEWRQGTRMPTRVFFHWRLILAFPGSAFLAGSCSAFGGVCLDPALATRRIGRVMRNPS